MTSCYSCVLKLVYKRKRVYKAIYYALCHYVLMSQDIFNFFFVTSSNIVVRLLKCRRREDIAKFCLYKVSSHQECLLKSFRGILFKRNHQNSRTFDTKNFHIKLFLFQRRDIRGSESPYERLF